VTGRGLNAVNETAVVGRSCTTSRQAPPFPSDGRADAGIDRRARGAGRAGPGFSMSGPQADILAVERQQIEPIAHQASRVADAGSAELTHNLNAGRR
jgi:hypothetical protein